MSTGRIVSKTRKNSPNTYYYYQRSYRVKIDTRARGKVRGSGPSRVVTEEVYLGTADTVLGKCQDVATPSEVASRSFGLECAALSVARELNLVDIIDRHVSKRRQGLSVGQYLVIAAINRICAPSSRRSLSSWFDTSVLPEVMQVDSRLLKSQNFWDAFDTMLSERDIKDRRAAAEAGELPAEDILDDTVIFDIEHDVWEHLLTIHKLHLNPLIYDTTNFYSFLDATTTSDYSQYAKSKDQKQGHRCVGLALGLTQPDGLPLFHLLYPANQHDSKLFPDALRRITERFIRLMGSTHRLKLVMDKGNNSATNIEQAAGEAKMIVVGSLVPSHYDDLMSKRLDKYTHTVKGLPAYREVREVFGRRSVVVVTYNEKLKRRQHRRLKTKLESIQRRLRELFDRHHRSESKDQLERRLRKLLSGRDVALYVTFEILGRRFKRLELNLDQQKLRKKVARLGKNVLFSTDPTMTAEALVKLYRDRNHVEETFKLEKAPDGVPFRPAYCWTDSKLRVYAFICVLALLIWRLLQYKLKQAGLVMSDHVVKMELRDLREVALMYGPNRVQHHVTQRSGVQNEMVRALGLESYIPEPL